ncbi:ERVV1 protein, partial [Rynchops niger]|nr:ERVV1 protein [Rynchops niger]
LSAYGWSMQSTNDSLWNNDTAKALPPGYFLICGDRAWAGIPKNAYGGPCYIGKLTLLTISHKDWLKLTHPTSHRAKRSLTQLSADCNDNVELWSTTANVFASLVPSMGTAQALAQLKKLACWLVKQANATTEALNEMAQDMDSLRHAVLQNRAAIDFLLLAQGHGYEDVEGMCCFNLSDHSNSIHKQLQWLKDHTKKIAVGSNPFDDWLQSIFGGLSPWLLSLV